MHLVKHEVMITGRSSPYQASLCMHSAIFTNFAFELSNRDSGCNAVFTCLWANLLKALTLSSLSMLAIDIFLAFIELASLIPGKQVVLGYECRHGQVEVK